jgi:hypothetical protein
VQRLVLDQRLLAELLGRLEQLAIEQLAELPLEVADLRFGFHRSS